jgi:hypothetical protein
MALGISKLTVLNIEDFPAGAASVPGEKKKVEAAVPGKPSYHFYVEK